VINVRSVIIFIDSHFEHYKLCGYSQGNNEVVKQEKLPKKFYDLEELDKAQL
jgi:hypothetical protein